MKFVDRLLTIIVTATLTSAVWIVFGSTFLETATGSQTDELALDGGLRNGAAVVDEKTGERAASQDDLPTPAEPSGQPTLQPSAQTSSQQPASSPVARQETALAMPVEGISPRALTDSFLDPRGPGGIRRHEAIDIMAAKGTPVLAAAPGRIAKLHRSKAGGTSIYVRSNDKETLYFYAHLDNYADGLKEGQRIATGDVLGTVGSSGNAAPDAPHLHFAVFQTTRDAQWWEPANAINPYPLLTEPVR